MHAQIDRTTTTPLDERWTALPAEESVPADLTGKRTFPGRRIAPSPEARTFALIAITLVAYIWEHWLTRSRFLFDLDSIGYARAMDHFDLRLTQPALPGYYLYIQLGRLVRWVAVDANTSLVALSIGFGALVIVAIYLLGRELFDERTGLIAALLTVSGPIYWYQSSFASPRIAEGFFASAIVWAGVRLRRTSDLRFFWLLPLLLALAGGVRQQTLVYLIPFCIWATWRVSWRQRLLGGAVCAVGCLTWGIPTIVGAGGLAEYRALSSSQWQEFVVGETGAMYGRSALEVLRRLTVSLSQIILYGTYTCLPAAVILTAGYRKNRHLRTMLSSFQGQALLYATLPALAFFTFVHVQQIGHFMAVAPFLTILLARILRGIPDRSRLYGSVMFIVLIDLAFVFLAPSRLVSGHFGTPTVATIRERDAFISTGVAVIRSTAPDTTLVITSPLSYGFIEQYAPEYKYYLIPGIFSTSARSSASPDQRVLTNGLRDIAGTVRIGPGDAAAPPRVRNFVLFSYETDLTHMVDRLPRSQRPAPDTATLAVVHSSSPTNIRFKPGHFTLWEASNGSSR